MSNCGPTVGTGRWSLCYLLVVLSPGHVPVGMPGAGATGLSVPGGKQRLCLQLVAARRMGGPGRKALCFPEIPMGLGPLQHLHEAFRGKKPKTLSLLQLVGTARCPAFP